MEFVFLQDQGNAVNPLKIQLLLALNTPKFTTLLLEKAKENGLKSCARVRAGGHNNIEINPVFRGML